ncbi:hypothetical protein Agabi119p4_5160 [Agaricus bisporus var. burnettii]|uniref:Uncharacterized protein n=1 Tax=Agaricus bisporus var. burnettii TaxID=192524 RepID=A0A8H7F4M5_AGABI|nr:hypothetical protein Agabi119p4_5160 [Agaricus bisporus var. burnettii]
MSSVSRPSDTNLDTPRSVDGPSASFSHVQASSYVRTVLANPNTNHAALREALRTCQIALDEKTEENLVLQKELSSLKASLTSDIQRAAKLGHKRQRGAKNLDGTPLEPVKTIINKDVRALAAMHFLWLGDNSFQQTPLLSNPFPFAPDRYPPDENLDLYHTYILYSELPHKYHALLEGSCMLKEEIQHLFLLERSTLVKNIRKVAPDIFFGSPPIVGQAVFLREQTRALERDPKPAFKYLELPPLLFPELDTSRAQEIFRSDILIQVARCMLFGEKAPGRAVAFKQGQIARIAISSNCLARQRKITKASPGLIAAAAILVSFVLSGDPTFSEKGMETGVTYRSRYFKYKLLLEESQEAGESHTMATFAYWNEQLFGENGSRGESFDFGENTADDDEMASHRRAVLQSQDRSMSTPHPQPLASHPLSGTSTRTSFPLSTTSTPNLSYSSTHRALAHSDAEPGSIHLERENSSEDRDAQDTASDSDVTPPASAISWSPNPILATSMTPSDNDSELVQQFHAHLSLVDTQPSVSLDNSSIAPGPGVGPESGLNANRTTQVVRRGRLAGRVPRTSKQTPGPSRSSSRQVPVTAAPTEIRSRLQTRTNAQGRS